MRVRFIPIGGWTPRTVLVAITPMAIALHMFAFPFHSFSRYDDNDECSHRQSILLVSHSHTLQRAMKVSSYPSFPGVTLIYHSSWLNRNP